MNTAAVMNNTVNVALTITADDIINGGKWKETERFSAEKHVHIIVDIGNSGMLKNQLNEEQINNLARFFCVTRFEQSALLWWVMCDSSNNIKNVIAFHQCRIPDTVFRPSIHLHYMVQNDSKDKNERYHDRAIRSINPVFKSSTEHAFHDLISYSLPSITE